MAAKLKVFVTSDGLTDYVVAASSRPKALAAWEAHQDLFANGSAHETDDRDLVKTALARPGQVLRRPARTQVLPAALPKSVKLKGPSKAALRKLEAAERALAAVDADHEKILEQIAAQRADLDACEAEEAEIYEAALVRAKDAVARARRAL